MLGIKASLPPELLARIAVDLRVHLASNPSYKFIDYLRLTAIPALDRYLTPLGYPQVEYAIVFRYLEDTKQAIHLDGLESNNIRRASLNVLLKEEPATFEWFDVGNTNHAQTDVAIPSFKFEDSTEFKLIESQAVPQVQWVTTNVPHRFVAHEPLNLVCIRFKNNPDFESLKHIWE